LTQADKHGVPPPPVRCVVNLKGALQWMGGLGLVGGIRRLLKKMLDLDMERTFHA